MCVLFGLSYPLVNDLFTGWVSLGDLSRLDCACMSKSSRESFITMVASAALAIDCPEMSRSSVFEIFLLWLKHRSVYMKEFKSPTRIFDSNVLSMGGFPHFKMLLRLDLSQCEDLTDRAFVQLVERSPRLRMLHVGGRAQRSWLADKALEALTGCRDLTHLVFKNLSLVTDSGVARAVQGLPNLRQVRIVICSEVGDVTMAALAATCRRLEVLAIADNRAISSHGLGLVCNACVELRELSLHRCRAALPPPTLSKGLRLQLFSFTGHKQCVAPGLGSFLRGCPDLARLHFGNLALAAVLETIPVMPLLQQLKDLTITDSPEVVPEAMLLLLRGVSAQLQRVSLANMHVSDALVVGIARVCTQLRELDLSWCASITDAALGVVAECCAQLEKLCVKGCGRLTTASVVRALSDLAALKELNAQYCPLLQADYVRDAAMRGGRAVTVVL